MRLWTIQKLYARLHRSTRHMDTQLKAYTNMLSSYGVDLATYAGMIEATRTASSRRSARKPRKWRNSLVLNEIAKQENITDRRFDKEALAKRYGYESLETMLPNDKHRSEDGGRYGTDAEDT